MKNICGVDISKARLDACIEPGSIRGSFANDAAGIAGLEAFCRQHRVELVAMEATGGYERRAFWLLWEQGLPCTVTNARQVRLYAEAMGVLEKTDAIDAHIIARFAQAKNLKPTPLPSSSQQRLKALVARLRQLTDDLTVQKQRRSSLLDNAEMPASIDEVIALLKRQSRTLEGEIGSMINDDSLWACLSSTFRSIKGVADRAVAWIMADLPEIGTYSNKAIAKLVGVSPIANDSGKRRGKRPSLLATTKASVISAPGWSLLEKKKWSSASPWRASYLSASTQKHAMRAPDMPMQLDFPDSRSSVSIAFHAIDPPSPTRGEGKEARALICQTSPLPRRKGCLELERGRRDLLGKCAAR